MRVRAPDGDVVDDGDDHYLPLTTAAVRLLDRHGLSPS
jgi:hypothetical protein